MAEKRMFSKKIIDTDWFMDMPASSQNLYFHLSMRADDDGFVANPKRIIKLVGASEDDYKILIGKKFIIPFESGICVISDWRINNYLRADRYTETIYKDEKTLLSVDENGKYELGIPDGIPLVATEYSNSLSNSILLDNKTIDYQDIIKEYSFTEETINTIKLWIKYKKEKKQSYKHTGFKTLLNKLKKWENEFGSEYIAEAVNNSISQNYDGIFPPKDSQIKKKDNTMDILKNLYKEYSEVKE